MEVCLAEVLYKLHCMTVLILCLICALKFAHKHENFRLKPLKENGRGWIRQGKERGSLGYFVHGPKFLVTPLPKNHF